MTLWTGVFIADLRRADAKNRSTATLREQQTEAAKLEAAIAANLKGFRHAG